MIWIRLVLEVARERWKSREEGTDSLCEGHEGHPQADRIHPLRTMNSDFDCDTCTDSSPIHASSFDQTRVPCPFPLLLPPVAHTLATRHLLLPRSRDSPEYSFYCPTLSIFLLKKKLVLMPWYYPPHEKEWAESPIPYCTHKY